MTVMQRTLGTCYYPEHWPRDIWQDDARRMVMGGAVALRVTGCPQRDGIVVHLIAQQIEDLSPRLSDLGHPMDDAVGITQPQAADVL